MARRVQSRSSFVLNVSNPDGRASTITTDPIAGPSIEGVTWTFRLCQEINRRPGSHPGNHPFEGLQRAARTRPPSGELARSRGVHGRGRRPIGRVGPGHAGLSGSSYRP